MEFLIARLATKEQAYALTKEKKWPQLDKVSGSYTAFSVGNFFFLLPQSAYRGSGSKLILFDGHATIADKALSAAYRDEKNAEILEDYLHDEIHGRITPQAVSGVFCAGEVLPETGEFSLHLDPLSQYNLLYVDHQKIKIVSNNIYCIEKAMKMAGLATTRSILNAAWEAAVGGCGHLTTGLEEATLTPPDHFVTGNARRNQFGWLKRNRLATRDAPPASETAKSIASSLEAIHNTFGRHDIVYDLTGGIDSRVVLGGSRHSGQRQQVFFNNRNSADYDTIIPNLIAQKYALRRADFPTNFNGETVTRQQLARRAVFRQQGLTTAYSYSLGCYKLSDICRIRGGVGEIMRSVYLPHEPRSIKGKLKKLHAIYCLKTMASRIAAFKSSPSRHGALQTNLSSIASLFSQRVGPRAPLFTKDFKNSLYDKTLTTLEQLAQLGITEDNLLNGLYLTSRSRRHFGYTSQMFNHILPSFEPLANINLWHYANSHSSAQRRNGDVIFNLLKIMDEDLLSVPLQAPELAKSSLDFNLFDRSSDWNTPTPSEFRTKQCEGPIVADCNSPNPYMGHGAVMFPNINLFFELLFSLDSNHSVWNTIDKKHFERLYASADTERVMTSSESYLRLFYGLIWIHKLEEATPVSGVC